MKKTFAVKQEYRDGMGATVRDMLESIGVKYADRPVTFHLDGTVTVNVTESELDMMRGELEGLVEYTGHSNNGNVRVSSDATDEYFEANPPTLTDAERAARKAKSGGKGGGVSKEESARRRAMLEARKARLLDTHGIDLDADADDGDDEE